LLANLKFPKLQYPFIGVSKLPYCQRCGTQLEQGAHFCHKCGAPAATFAPIATPPATITSTPIQPIKSDSLFVISMAVIAIVLSVIVIFALIFLVFHVNFGQTNPNQSNGNMLYLFNVLFHKPMPLLNFMT
jgi:uncharacterized membrane protein YvbJ